MCINKGNINNKKKRMNDIERVELYKHIWKQRLNYNFEKQYFDKLMMWK